MLFGLNASNCSLERVMVTVKTWGGVGGGFGVVVLWWVVVL